jgi:hypothetical protein
MTLIDGDGTKSVARLVREAIQMRPSLIDALKMGIVNYSALARMLQEEIGQGSAEAVKAAVIRIAEDLSKERRLQEEEVRGILKESKVRLQDKIAVLISPIKLDISYLVTAYLTDSYVYIVDQTGLGKDLPKQVQVMSNLVARHKHYRVHQLLHKHNNSSRHKGRPKGVQPASELYLTKSK